MIIAPQLIKWYHKNKRDLPWRNVDDPYLIWLSEIILQQTRVAQGLGYYLRFMAAFPDIRSLAAASEDDVLKLWQGLGYYSRARNLHDTAKYIVSELDGLFPDNFNDLQKLKGVGKYTAAAIASFAFNEPVPVVDGNVCRVLARLFEIDEQVGNTKSFNKFFQIAETLIDKSKPGIFNQAVMELGALVCVPSNPSCAICPVREPCGAFQNGSVDRFPVRARIIPKTRYFHYLVILYKNKVYIKKRTDSDIWFNLFDFPLIETRTIADLDKIKCDPLWAQLFGPATINMIEAAVPMKHKLTHQTLHVNFYKIKVSVPIRIKSGHYLLIPVNKISDFAVPKLIELYASEFLQ